MRARYLLDSDVLIWVLRNRKETVSLVQHLLRESGEPLSCSALSALEVWVGAKPGEETKTDILFSSLDTVPVDGKIARRAAGLLRARRTRETGDWVDAMIAASAMIHGMTLVTYNRKDYPYPGMSLYPT